MAVTIVEVVKRATQGRTAPYLCRGDDGALYFVKNRALPRRELAAEWISANLAEVVGLPIPPFAQVVVPEELADPSLGGWLRDLGSGPAFGSKLIEGSELAWQQIDATPPSLRRIVAAFDWWIRNMDRTLSGHGGNPNMLWQRANAEGGLAIIDHNLAFDEAFNAQEFFDSHIFASDLRDLVGDMFAREEVRASFQLALPEAEAACAQIPDEWRFVDPELTIPVSWLDQEFLATLERCYDSGEFWTIPP